MQYVVENVPLRNPYEMILRCFSWAYRERYALGLRKSFFFRERFRESHLWAGIFSTAGVPARCVAKGSCF